jgi:hypothetical protein
MSYNLTTEMGYQKRIISKTPEGKELTIAQLVNIVAQ